MKAAPHNLKDEAPPEGRALNLHLEAGFKTDINGVRFGILIRDKLRGRERNEAFIIDIFRAEIDIGAKFVLNA